MVTPDNNRSVSAALHRGAVNAAETSTNGEYVSAAVNFRLPWLRKIRDEAELKLVHQAAAADSDAIVAPTHLIELGGRIAGAVALGSVTLLDVWAHRELIKARQSLHLLNVLENVAAACNARAVCLPCAGHSPYRPFMQQFGFRFAGQSGLYYKNL